MAPKIVVVLDSNLPRPPAILHRADTPAPRSPTTATPVTGSTIGAALLCLQAMDQACNVSVLAAREKVPLLVVMLLPKSL
jgi:hypothetical protein